MNLLNRSKSTSSLLKREEFSRPADDGYGRDGVMCRSGLICSELSGWLREGLCEWLCIWDLTQREIYLESINILLRLNTQNTQWSFLKTSQTSDYRHRNIFLCLLYLKYCTPPPQAGIVMQQKNLPLPTPPPLGKCIRPPHTIPAPRSHSGGSVLSTSYPTELRGECELWAWMQIRLDSCHLVHTTWASI